MKTKSVIYRGRARTIEDAVEIWKAEHDNAMQVREIEDIVREGIWMHHFLDGWQKSAWEQLWSGQLDSVLEAGSMLRHAFKTAKKLGGLIRGCIAWAENKGYTVDNSADFDNAAQAMELLSSDFEKRWPSLDPKDIEAGLAEASRGEGQYVEDVIRELQVADHSDG